jgi:hypothetical protein
MKEDELLRDALANRLPLHLVDDYLEWREKATREKGADPKTFWEWFSGAWPTASRVGAERACLFSKRPTRRWRTG